MLWRHILGYLPANLAKGLVGFGSIVLYTRLLDPADYGRYALVLALIHLLQAACFTWIAAAVARFQAGAERDGSVPDQLATAGTAYLLTAALVSVAYFAVLRAVSIDPALHDLLIVGWATLLIRSLTSIGFEAHRASRRVGRYAALSSVQNLLGLALGVALILFSGLTAAAPILALAIAGALTLAIEAPFFGRRLPGGSASRSGVAHFAAYGIPVSMSLIFGQILSNSDRFLIEHFMGPAAVGMYAAGYGVADRSLDIAFVWLSMAASPLAVVALEQKGPEAARAMLDRFARTLLLVTVPAAAGLALVARPLTDVMVGSEFRPVARDIVPWIALSGWLNGITVYYFNAAFMLARRTGLMAVLMLVPAAGNVALNFVLIPRYGLTGAVASTVLAYAIGTGLSIAVGRRFFTLPIPWAAAGRIAAATCVMVPAVRALPEWPGAAGLIGAVAVGAGVYGAVALALGLVPRR